MIKRIIAIPGQLYKSALRLIGAAIAFTFTSYMYVSGQTAQVNQQNNDKGTEGNDPTIEKNVIIIDPSMPVPMYGILYINYSIKGTVKDINSKSAIPDIEVSVTDTLTKQPIKTTTTQSDGSFSFSFASSSYRNSWFINVRDKDSQQNGVFEDKDTLLSMTPDDFKNGVGTLDVDINVSEKTKTAIKLNNFSTTGKLQNSIAVQQANNEIAVRYSLDNQSRVAINLFSIDGKQIRRICDNYQTSGEHTVSIEPACLPTGTYLLQVQTDSDIAVSKVQIEH